MSSPAEHDESSASDVPSPEPAGHQPGGRRAPHDVVHAWIPLTIAIVSVLAALMGWRASLADESATHTQELSRQALVQQQQLLVQNNDAVNTDLRTFGQFTQYSLLAHSLLHDAGRVGGGGADQLRAEGQADLGIARYLGKQISYLNYGFDPSNPSGNSALHSDGTYLAGHPYAPDLALDVAKNVDASLHGLQPEQLHSKAEAERAHGVDLTGIAALFVAVMRGSDRGRSRHRVKQRLLMFQAPTPRHACRQASTRSSSTSTDTWRAVPPHVQPGRRSTPFASAPSTARSVSRQAGSLSGRSAQARMATSPLTRAEGL